jgi:hypothetical protein
MKRKSLNSIKRKNKVTKRLVLNNEFKSKEYNFAEIAQSSATLNTLTSRSFSKSLIGDTDLAHSISVMNGKIAKVNSGDLRELEATLTAQSVSLDLIFNHLVQFAIKTETLLKVESYMRLALKAQSQCSRTIEVLATMKRPQVIFANQANISNGHQQVNNNRNEPIKSLQEEKVINKKTNY